MGGQQLLHYMSSGPSDVLQHVRGFLIEAPFVDFNAKSKPNGLTVFFGRLAGRLLPHRQLTNKLDANLVTRDPEVNRRYEADELCHDTGTLEGLAGMLDRTAMLSKGQVEIRDDIGEGGVTRVWFAHGDKDGICDYEASKRFAEGMKVKDKEFKTYEGYFHKSKLAFWEGWGDADDYSARGGGQR